MPVVDQFIIIKASLHTVMATLNDVENFPGWATVSGTISNVQGSGLGMSYDWLYTFNKIEFKGHSVVLEQTDTTLITRTSGDVDSLWTVKLTPAGPGSTALQVTVEYTPPNSFIELLADIVLEQLNNPEIARQNLANFKAAAEARARATEDQIVAHA
ncbi:MAG: hypothetical protein Kow0031_12840 [Anaerolineae bacterium]